MKDYYAAQIESTRRSIAGLEQQAGRAVITAPMEGVVEKLPINDQNVVSAAAAVAQIGAEPAVEVYVPIREIDSVKPGDRVFIELDRRLGEDVVGGTVRSVDDKAELKISALGVEERKVRVLADLTRDIGIMPGFEMDVEFTVADLTGAVVVPKTAVFEWNGADTVWVLEDGVARRRWIKTGLETRDGYEITEGLSHGESIITNSDAEGVSDGKRVRIS
jgi:HlyD family secretion protein